ncbi:2-oxo acid dehydrogenase subunit E2 [Kineosporia sp. J2-2]|uniref:Dihydrolipoamide acetyltransferase component of pyruvate dehydrogenase complex n=1 Tax=Kineosporia corallincola TaxID=2835133 RepID=A0ABS5TSI0_9ACTN|nr:dihydrolipoamide acetyltransferase family protein [Kineosporia corallincola]MBT0773740.1 2-oxo acid dehydrogenase subunit E2 [Kineosporia corallincola]
MTRTTSGQQFRLPDVGEGLTEAEIVTWRVAVGDEVAVNDPLVEIETAKSLVELPSPYAGVVGELLVPAGELVPVGTPIVTITQLGHPAAGSAGTSRPEPSSAVPGADGELAGGSPSVLVGYGPGHSRGRSRRRPPVRTPGAPGRPETSSPAREPVAEPVAEPLLPVPEAGPASPVRPLAKPPVRKLARDLGIDLGAVRATGGGGVITRQDVLAARAASTVAPPAPSGTGSDLSPAPAAAPTGQDDEHVPVRGVRAATAAAMTASAFTAPHVTVFHTVDVTRSVKLVARLREHPAFAGARVTVMLLAARALCLAAREMPDLNATFSGPAREIVLHRRVHLGVATASGRGLLVPTVEDAAQLALPALARELTRVTELARSGTAGPSDLTGSTITLTNIGVFGVDSGTPILNPGQSAILCLGAVRRTPVEHRGRIALRWTTQLAMSFDHRIIDGQLGAQAVARIGAVLKNPRDELLLV